MKKIMKLCLATFLVLGLAGCTGPKVSEEAIDRYIEVSKNSMNMKSADYSLNVNFTVDDQDVKVKAYGAYDATSDLKLNMNMDMTMMGESMNNLLSLYLADSTMYVDVLGEKDAYSFAEYKSMIDYLIKNSIQQGSDTEVDKEKIKEMFKGAELKDNHLILTVDKSNFDEVIKESTAEADLEGLKMDISDMVMDITIEDEFMTNMVMDVEIDMKAKDIDSQNMKMHMTMGFTNINSEKNIPAPDLTQYPDPTNFTDAL